MILKTLGILVALLSIGYSGYAQSDLEAALASIRKNNKTILASQQYIQAKKLQHRTGNSPDDPYIEADLLAGRPRSGGNQVDIIAVQPFDFPTVYSKRGQLADRKDLLHDIELESLEKEILWEAKQIGLLVIFHNKHRQLLTGRLEEAKEVLDDFEAKFAAEEIGVLEVNKARIRVFGIQHDLSNLITEIATQTTHLIELNGGIELSIEDTLYPEPFVLPSLDSLLDMVIANDPLLKLKQQEQFVAAKEVEVERAMALPKLATGYHYQSVLGQTFNGVHLGTSIPLWQNRNKVKARKSLVLFYEKEEADRRVQLIQETKKHYQYYQNMRQNLLDYRQALNGLIADTKVILQKSLELGEMDFITYAKEMDYYYESFDKFLEIEHSYHKIVSAVLKSTL